MTVAVSIFFQAIVFLFAICVHESAHAWMADRCGDPTAKMLGRISMNPLKHIDPIGTILLPLIALISGVGIFGWAKPTPVTAANFRRPVWGDILTTVAGPVSNFLLVIGSLITLMVIAVLSPVGHQLIGNIARGNPSGPDSILFPIVVLLYIAIDLNLLLGIFNLFPIPPLDGSHIVRHLLPAPLLRIYDSMGIIGLALLFFFGGRVIHFLMSPVMNVVDKLLLLVAR